MISPRDLVPFFSLGLLAACASAPPATVVEPVAPEAPPQIAEQTIYCSHTVERFGVEQCPEPITAEAASHRTITFVLRSRDGRPVSKERVNGSGELVEDGREVAVSEYRYEGGRLREVAELSARRALRFRKVFSEDFARVSFVAPGGRPKLVWNLATQEVRELDASGLVMSRRFLDRLGRPTKDDDGAYELRYRRNENGYQVEMGVFDDKQRPVLNAKGFHRVAWERGPMGAGTAERYFGTGGEPVETAIGNHSDASSFDLWGNCIQVRHLDKSGNPVAYNKRYQASWRTKLDARGNPVEVAYFGPSGEPVNHPDGYAVRQRRFDAKGRVVQIALTGEDGKPVPWAPLRKLSYDQHGRETELAYLDADGKPPANREAFRRTAYDDRDNEVRVWLLDAGRKPVVGKDKYAEYRLQYNEDDQPVEKAYFGPNGEPTAAIDKYARAVFTYDAAGKRSRTEFFDAAGTVMPTFGCRHLLVMYAGSMRAEASLVRTKDEARARAEEARRKIVAGTSFEDAVRLYSDEPGAAGRGGDLGLFPPGRMVPTFESGLLATPVGQLSTVVETPFGFHVIERSQ